MHPTGWLSVVREELEILELIPGVVQQGGAKVPVTAREDPEGSHRLREDPA